MPQTDPDLDLLLDAVHAAIMRCDFPAMEELVPQTESLLATFNAQDDPIFLRRMQTKANRNAACLLAAARGIRAARRRLEEIAAVSHGLVAYDVNGNRAESRGTNSLSRRY